MIMPDFQSTDEVLEYAARLIEELTFSDIGGIMAKKKRDREDAQIRIKTIEENRADCARHIRAFKSRPDLDAKQVLRELSQLGGNPDVAVMHLRDAWPLAWKGWLKIYCVVCCTSNCIPPTTKYHIEITEKGRAILADKEVS